MTSANEFRFHLHATDGRARRGRLDTAHGPMETPAFMPVGTAATRIWDRSGICIGEVAAIATKPSLTT